MHDYYYYIKLDKDVKIFGKNKPVFDNFRKRGHLDEESIILLQEITRIEIKPPKDINIWNELFDKNTDFNKFHEKYDKKYKRKVVDDVMWFYADINEVLCMFFNEQAMGDTKQLGFDTAVVHIGTKEDYYKDMYYCNHWCSFETINHNLIQLYNDDCLNAMKDIPDKSIDMILCDLPYGITGCRCDNLIMFDKLWEHYSRITKDNGTIVLFSSGVFTIDLINSNNKEFKYKLIWKKNVPTGMASAKYRPMKYYEEICIFQKGKGVYNPILKDRVGVGKSCYKYNHYCGKNNHITLEKIKKKYNPDKVQPSDVLEFNVVPNRNNKLHPMQKPVELLEYLIKTYTNEGDLVLDNCMGSGSTGVACINTNRNFIGIELDENYFRIARNRINEVQNDTTNK